MPDGPVERFACSIGDLEVISAHDKDLTRLVMRLAAKEGTLEDVRVVLGSTHAGGTEGGPDALIDEYGLVVSSYLAGIALAAGIGLDEDDAEDDTTKKPRPIRGSTSGS